MAARVVFIGAGPGAADLMTLRGAKALGQAQVVLYDALTDPALRAMAPQAQWIDVGKRGFRHATSQPEINALLLEAARAHERVVRLKGGDPSVLGRLEEELETLLAEGIECEVIPGISPRGGCGVAGEGLPAQGPGSPEGRGRRGQPLADRPR